MALVLLEAAPLSGSVAVLPRELQRAARDLARIAPASGVHVVSLPDGATVWGKDPDIPRILASNTKLFTTAAALDLLGPGYFFETPLLARGAITGGVLQGDLAVVGAGDPSFDGRFHDDDAFAVFREWARELRRRGVERISGDLLLVHGLFDDELVHPDWPRDQLDRWYEAPVDALGFFDNTVLTRVWGDRAGSRAVAELRPPLPMVELANSAVATGEVRAHSLVIGRAPERSTIEVRGKVWNRGQPVEKWVSIPDPVTWFGQALRHALVLEGIAIDGLSRPIEALPAGRWMDIAVHRTSLLDVIAVVNKRSQNLWAESLFKVLGARHCGDGSFAGGVRAVQFGLERIGATSASPIELVDGSGMSRGNRASPRAVTNLLAAMAHHAWGRELAASLAAAGDPNGGLSHRLREQPYRGNVTAKTGTLATVSALSGYAKARSGRLYAFSILCNRAQTSAARAAQDRVVRALVDYG